MYIRIIKIKPLEKIPYKTDKRVIIIFLDNTDDKIWNNTVAEDFVKGYSRKDTAYDKL